MHCNIIQLTHLGETMKPEDCIQTTQKFFEDALKQTNEFNTNFQSNIMKAFNSNKISSFGDMPTNMPLTPNTKQFTEGAMEMTKTAKLTQETHLSHLKILADAQFKASETVLHELSEKGKIEPATFNKLAGEFQQHLVSYSAALMGLARETAQKTQNDFKNKTKQK